MHRTVTLAIPAAATAQVLDALKDQHGVIGLSVHRGCAIKPPGDLVIVDVLNCAADDVIKVAGTAKAHGPIVVATSEATSIIAPHRPGVVEEDVDAAIWEEMEAGLRHQGRVTPNFLALMAAGGSLAMIGHLADPVAQALAFASASIIAPGFEPLAKIPLGVLLRRWALVKIGIISTLAGYAALVASAALTFWLLQALGDATVAGFVHNREVEHLAHPKPASLLSSGIGAIAGAVMLIAYRRSVIAGPLIILAVISAGAMVGGALAAGRWDLAVAGLMRFGIDAAIIMVLCGAVFGIKQAFTRREPLA